MVLLQARGVSALVVVVQRPLPPLCLGFTTTFPSDFILLLWEELIRDSTTGSCDVTPSGTGMSGDSALVDVLQQTPMG
jgi:hypothetical protein